MLYGIGGWFKLQTILVDGEKHGWPIQIAISAVKNMSKEN